METIELEEFYVTGISVRTANEAGKSQKDIGQLFGKFFSEDVAGKIPNKSSNDVYCVYTEYEGDFNAPYTTILGCKVSDLKEIPEGLVGLTIPTAVYQVFRSEGKLPDCVGATWSKIWQSGIDRKYAADFDVYGKKSQNPNDAEVETFVSIK